MKRTGYLFDKIISIENLYLASKKAQKGKRNYSEIIVWNESLDANVLLLHKSLSDGSYRVSKYETFIVREPKERVISKLPFKDRVVHHAVISHLEPIFKRCFISQTYSCIKERGIHRCLYDLRKALNDNENTTYCLKMDIKKFYPSVNNELLKSLLRTKFKDQSLLNLLDIIIDSTQGIPLGNFTSQWFGNFYLNRFDHWIKEEKRIKYYFRYCDDLLMLGENKEGLHAIRIESQNYLKENCKLELSNYQVFPVQKRGIDFVGYVSFHSHTLLRKSIKKRFIKMIQTNKNRKSIASYRGWIKHCNGATLYNKYVSQS